MYLDAFESLVRSDVSLSLPSLLFSLSVMLLLSIWHLFSLISEAFLNLPTHPCQPKAKQYPDSTCQQRWSETPT